jgi:hypothetical protein
VKEAVAFYLPDRSGELSEAVELDAGWVAIGLDYRGRKNRWVRLDASASPPLINQRPRK